jgi:hypothetical protein
VRTFLDIEFGTMATRLDHLRHAHISGLECREALFTGQATATTTDAGPVFADAGVNDLRIGIATERTFHDVSIQCF